MDKLNEEQVRYKFHRYFRNLASLSLISFFPHIDGGLQPIAMFMFHPVKEVLTAAREILAKIAVNKVFDFFAY
ncbi:MAG: hypothetical protein EZS28_006858 [Streblomastix strix]|uniref:Uncharacterized protein n=1 Tax=Streblomastix strix TaxID=222440 RepID=A0A5J4WSX7_9EUKA|nr:MAG: hypothetical protein EZS28_006858 [Streblomastix strix]